MMTIMQTTMRMMRQKKGDATTEAASQWVKIMWMALAILLVLILLKLFLPNPGAVVAKIKAILMGAR